MTDKAMVMRNRMLVLPFLASVAFFYLTPNTVYASQFDKKCASDFPEWHQIWEKYSCVRRLEKQKAIEDEKKRREERARPCISKDVERMETQVKNIKDSIDENMTLDEAKEKITEILGTEILTQPTEFDIKKWVVIGRIPTTCASDFYFLVNVTAIQKGKVLHLGVWSKSAPKGYESGYLTNFSTNFKAERLRKQRAAEAEKRRAAEAERRREAEAMKRIAAEAEKKRKAEAARKRGEAMKKRAAEAMKKRETEARKRRAAKAELERIRNLPDPCAAGLSPKERLRRLSLSGKIRQTSDNTYVTDHHRIVFFLYDNSLIYCH